MWDDYFQICQATPKFTQLIDFPAYLQYFENQWKLGYWVSQVVSMNLTFLVMGEKKKNCLERELYKPYK